MYKRRIILAAGLALLCGCQSLIHFALEQATGQNLGYGDAECRRLQLQCHPEDYRSWLSPSGQRQCSCQSCFGDDNR
ncbi:hypothetical protein KUW19_17975 [Ferrimonas balearica]|uniref:hypothetical protein n=1 Tax=Ferrimonas balearica TaxID=44012 RepID=UPI001C973003|nr:hypothetical protein [Ferrimonas balearica]MBY6108354.1 hypothetical protein [Ferrimonas balearica]